MAPTRCWFARRPYFKQQLTTDVFVLHYTAVADASPAPVILYNFTAFTGVTLSVEALARLATHANIIGMKESGGDIGTLSTVVDQTLDEFSLLAGSVPAFYASLLCRAVGGVLALACVVPHLCVELYGLVQSNRLPEARALQRTLSPARASAPACTACPVSERRFRLHGYIRG